MLHHTAAAPRTQGAAAPALAAPTWRRCKSAPRGIQGFALSPPRHKRGCCGGLRAPRGALLLGPGPHSLPARALPSSRPDPLWCARLGPGGALFALSAPPAAPGPLPLRGVAPARRARPLCGPPRRPPGSPARALGALSRFLGRSLAPSAPALPSLRCGLPVVGLASSRARPLVSAWPRRAPPPGPSGLWGRRAPAPGPARPSGPLVVASGPGAFLLRAARLRAACCLRRGLLRRQCCVWGSFSPAAPRPAAPAGGSREREARWGFAPLWVALLAPLSRAPGALRARPGAPFPAR